MADGAKSIGNQFTSTLKDIGKELTVNLVSDMFNLQPQKSPTQAQPTAQNSMQQLAQAQKNAKIAQILRRIQAMKKRQQFAIKLTQQREEERLRADQEEEQQKKQLKQQEKIGGTNKLKNLFANWGNTLARRGKGEQRGNKMYG